MPAATPELVVLAPRLLSIPAWKEQTSCITTNLFGIWRPRTSRTSRTTPASIVESAEGFDLGRLDGFMVDPDEHTLRYYVVTRFGERSMKLGLVPFVPGLS